MSVGGSTSLKSSICNDDFSTCIEVLKKFNSATAYPAIESKRFDDLRSLIADLSLIIRKKNKNKLRDERRQCKSIDKKKKASCLLRSERKQKLEQLQLQHILVPDGAVELSSTMPAIESDKKSLTNTSERLLHAIKCYVCKLHYRSLHFFYDRLCPACAKLNFQKRLQTTDLSNRTALVTGARIKIGYRIVLKLLRANCFVIATTRFPMDLLNRLNNEHDFHQWKNRIHIYGVDFRYAQLVEQFTQMLIEKYDRLDFLINNACQTIQRPKEFYQHLFNGERLLNYSHLSDDHQQILDGNLQFYKHIFPSADRLLYQSASSLPLAYDEPFETPKKVVMTNNILFDVNQQPIDFRSTNSWMLHLDELSSNEVNEVLTINTLAPFILNSKLKILMADKHPDPQSIKFIINVSAMEGSFSRRNKTDRHPHTNAAKAALNMMTRTSANDYKKSNIYMVSVDTG